MKFFAFVAPLLMGAAFAADYNSVTNQINLLGNFSTTLGNDVQKFNGGVQGIPFALQVQQDAIIIYRQLQAATAEANASPAFGSGSSTVSSALLRTKQLVQTTLTNTQNKASTFADLGPLVLSALYQLRANTGTFADAVIAKLSEPYKSNSATLKQQLIDSFNAAIKAYGGTT